MKRLLIIVVCFLFFCGCSLLPKNTNEPKPQQNDFLVGVWISLYEMKSVGLNESEFTKKFDSMFQNIKNLGANTVFCHIRPKSDAYYRSELFPFSDGLTGTQGGDPGFDPMTILTDLAKEHNLYFHAWLNPYRIASGIESVSELSEKNPARIWLEDENEQNDGNVKTVTVNDTKVFYYNPASIEVQKLVLDGVREILNNYEVDGIHIDDYFYPTTDKEFDKTEYERYKKSTKTPLSLEDWRRTNVDALVSSMYNICRSYGKVFGVSPSAHISEDGTDENYQKQYANITKWMSNEGYIDYIAPQLYFGYEYPDVNYKFTNLLNKWTKLERLDSVKLYIGLANYKIGEEDAGSDEWQKQTDIIARQIEQSRLLGTDGVIFYSYSALFSEQELNTAQRIKAQEILSESS